MKNNRCPECGKYYFQCRCHGRKGVPDRTKKHEHTHAHVAAPRAPRAPRAAPDFDHDGVPDDVDGAIQRINEAEREFFGDDEL